LEELKAKDLSLPRNPLISKLFRMVRLAENAGYGFDKIETNWEQYNHTAPEYDISFDATILKLYTQKEEAETKTSGKLRGSFGETSEKLQEALKNKPTNIDLIIRLLTDNYESFKIYITENFGVSSGTLRERFGNTSEMLRKHFGEKEIVLLLLIIFNKDITAKEAAKVIGVSDRTIETYFTKLKSKNIIERVGSATFGGYWALKKD